MQQAEACRDHDVVVRDAVARSGRDLQHASDRLRADRVTVYIAVQQSADAVRFANAALLDDATWSGLVNMNPEVLPFVPVRLLEDGVLVARSVQTGIARRPDILRRFPWSLFAQRDDVLNAAVRGRPQALWDVPADRRSRALKAIAVAGEPSLLALLPEEAADAAFVAELAQRQGRVLLYATPAVQRNADLVRAADTGWKTACADEPKLSPCLRPLQDAADAALEAALSSWLEPAATSAQACPVAPADTPRPDLACAAALLGRGVLADAGDAVVHLASRGDAVRITVASVVSDGLTVRQVTEHDDEPLLRGLVAMQPAGTQLTIAGIQLDDPADDFGVVSGRGPWVSRQPLPAATAVVCTDGRVRALGRLVARAPARAFTWVIEHRYELPCDARLVVPAGVLQIGTRVRLLPSPPADAPYVQGVRVRPLGRGARLDEHEGSGGCVLTAGARSLSLNNPGCGLVLAAELNGDGVPDVVVHTSGESCSCETLYRSTATGWDPVAESCGCC
jgi:hypothetical protein